MRSHLIKKTIASPSVNMIKAERKIVLRGSSRLEDPMPFYLEVDELIENCLLEFKTQLTIDFYLEYINTNSSKWLFHIIKNLQLKYIGKKLITINWYFEEDDEIIEEAGEVFQSLLSIPFNLIPIKTK